MTSTTNNDATNNNDGPLQVTPNTKIAEVLKRYGDMADVMETLGVKRVGRYNVRRLLGKALTVRLAAVAHRLSTEDMVNTLQTAIDRVHANGGDVDGAQ